MKDVKPGPTTTEFWLVVIVVLTASIASLIEVFRGHLDAAGAVALVSAAVATASYAHGRSVVKRRSE
jgi:hypothetical protein